MPGLYGLQGLGRVREMLGYVGVYLYLGITGMHLHKKSRPHAVEHRRGYGYWNSDEPKGAKERPIQQRGVEVGGHSTQGRYAKDLGMRASV
jgi:hypothetical protein